MLTLKTNLATYCQKSSIQSTFCYVNMRCWRLGSQDVHQTQISVALEKILEPLVMPLLSGVVW